MGNIFNSLTRFKEEFDRAFECDIKTIRNKTDEIMDFEVLCMQMQNLLKEMIEKHTFFKDKRHGSD